MVYALNCDAPRATQPTEKDNVSSFKVLYKRRHLKMYILFPLPIILIIIIIIIILIIVKIIINGVYF